jgi:hypothetical protein
MLWGCPFSTQKDEDNGDPPPPVTYKSPTAPESLLFNLNAAYEDKNIEEYIPLFADDFTFVFNPLDAQNDTLDIPESWGLADEIEAHQRIFSEPDIEDIKLDWTLGPWLPPEIANTDVKIIARPLFLEVTQRLPEGEPLFLQAQGAAWFHFRKTDETTAEGDTIWEIVWWEDKTQL